MCAAADISSRDEPPRPRVLVIEDDPAILEVLDRFLRQSGCVPFTAGNAEEGIAALSRQHADLVLLDINLPGMIGLEAIWEIAERSSAPMVVMTRHADGELSKDARFLGARVLLQKPLDFRTIEKTLHELL